MQTWMKYLAKLLPALLLCCLFSGCTSVKMRLFTDTRDPLKEFTLSGHGSDKIAVIHVSGLISDVPGWSFLTTKGSMVQEVVAQLNLAAEDRNVKAVVLKVNTPGGTVTGSDILYHEIVKFKKRTGKKVIVMMMDMATSGGYYVALPADYIIAHPTTITGSVGVIFMRPKLYSLMNKLGVQVDINKSGQNKDMGSPFRPATPEENELFKNLIGKLGNRFVGLVEKHRKLDAEAREKVASARIFLADEAKKLNMIDDIGYIHKALKQAKKMAKTSPHARVVVYRRSYYPDDNIYNTTNSHYQSSSMSVVNLGPLNALKNLQSGFYFIWQPGLPE